MIVELVCDMSIVFDAARLILTENRPHFVESISSTFALSQKDSASAPSRIPHVYWTGRAAARALDSFQRLLAKRPRRQTQQRLNSARNRAPARSPSPSNANTLNPNVSSASNTSTSTTSVASSTSTAATSASNIEYGLFPTYSMTNHFPGIEEVCTKLFSSHKLRLFSRLFPQEYKFVPKTWLLPQDTESLKSYFMQQNGPSTGTNTGIAPQTIIFKPSEGSQGAGIQLAQKWSDAEKIIKGAVYQGITMTAQEYVSKPLLLDGLKFDFRIYVLIESLDPLRIHLFKDGLARFCTEKYQEPTGRNLKSVYMHLTNSSLNKQHEQFKAVPATVLSHEEKTESQTVEDDCMDVPSSAHASSQGNGNADESTSSKRSIRLVLLVIAAAQDE